MKELFLWMMLKCVQCDYRLVHLPLIRSSLGSECMSHLCTLWARKIKIEKPHEKLRRQKIQVPSKGSLCWWIYSTGIWHITWITNFVSSQINSWNSVEYCIIAETLKAAEEEGVELTRQHSESAFSNVDVPGDWKVGFILNLCKGKGEALDCGNYVA